MFKPALKQDFGVSNSQPKQEMEEKSEETGLKSELKELYRLVAAT